MQRVAALTGSYGANFTAIQLEPTLPARLTYQSGFAFEILAPDGALMAHGGRYDDSIGLLGCGVDVPAVGLTVRLNALAKRSTPEHALRPLLAVELGDPVEDALKISTSLRVSGIACETVAPESETGHAVRLRVLRDQAGGPQVDHIDRSGSTTHTFPVADLLPALCLYISGGDAPR